jgi:hypothetical protein
MSFLKSYNCSINFRTSRNWSVMRYARSTPCEACTCERCTERKSRQKRAEGHNNSPDTVMRGFLRQRLLEFLCEYWETLKVNGLYHHESAQTFQWTVDSRPVHVRRLHYHLILEHLGTEDDLYLWRRSIAEINKS